MQTLDGHFDGKVVVLDAPAKLRPNTKVKILVLEPAESKEASTVDFALVAEPTFQKIWDNALDADYDKL